MKHYSQSPRTPSRLSDSVHHQLNMYTLAASAAGVGMLALVQPAEAKVVYTPTNITIVSGGAYSLDLNHDGRPDFTLSAWSACTTTCAGALAAFSASRLKGPNWVEAKDYQAGALHFGNRIGPHKTFSAWADMLSLVSGGVVRGYWDNVKDRYLGFRFYIDNKTHYGWARLDVHHHGDRITATLTGYAYETVPNKSIIAGKTKGPDVISVQPASLGHLAKGASAVSAWRVKQTAATTH